MLFAGVPSLGEALNSAAALAAAAIPGRLLHDSITGDYLTVLIISLAVVLLLLFNGWKGWEMVYRHGVGVWKQVRARGEALRWIPFRGPA